jgi:hypothetical protein
MTRDVIVKPPSYKLTTRAIARIKCDACGINIIKAGDYCMLQDEIWQEQFGLGWGDNLCIACIEQRLGREVTRDDFINCPQVEGYAMSLTLASRLRRKPRAKAKGGAL